MVKRAYAGSGPISKLGAISPINDFVFREKDRQGHRRRQRYCLAVLKNDAYFLTYKPRYLSRPTARNSESQYLDMCSSGIHLKEQGIPQSHFSLKIQILRHEVSRMT